MTKSARPTRRFVIGSALASAGGLALGFMLPGGAESASGQRAAALTVDGEINAWVVIRPDETVVVRIARTELGQGTLTGLAQLVAEELECEWSRITTEMPGPGLSLARDRAWGDFATMGSRGIRGSQDVVRRAAAAARQLLTEAAAGVLKVPVSELVARQGRVVHVATKRTLSYGRLSPLAAQLKAPDPRYVKLKDPRNWTIAGQSLKRLDGPDKVSGRAIYGIDIRLPGMLNAAIRDAPVFGARLAGFDASKVQDMPGVRHVVQVGQTAVAVVADSWWQAKTALEALPATWQNPPGDLTSSAAIAEHVKEGLDVRDGFIGQTHGDALKAIAGAARRLEAVYKLPYLHQATLEPMNCTALWTPERVDVWAPTQNAEAALKAAADAAGLPLSAAEVHRCLVGGGFGRRSRQDYVTQAVQIARQVPGTPIKLIWSREEDMANGYYRPASQCKLTGGLDEKGELAGLIMRLSGQSIVAAQLPQTQPAGKDARMFQGLYAEPGEAQIGYSIPSLYIDHVMRATPVPVGSWRGVHANANAIYLECFIDELARAAGRDPLEFRRVMMRSHPRHLTVLTAAAEKAGWGRADDPEGPRRGIAQLMSYGSYAAAVAEVSVNGAGRVRVHRVTLALDSGHVVNPDLVAAHIEGQVAFALGALLYQEITIRDGRVVEQNFDTYGVLRLAEMPVVETVLVPSGEFWGGVGEAAIAVVAPAILNAIHAATGKRVRSLPLKNVKLG